MERQENAEVQERERGRTEQWKGKEGRMGEVEDREWELEWEWEWGWE